MRNRCVVILALVAVSIMHSTTGWAAVVDDKGNMHGDDGLLEFIVQAMARLAWLALTLVLLTSGIALFVFLLLRPASRRQQAASASLAELAKDLPQQSAAAAREHLDVVKQFVNRHGLGRDLSLVALGVAALSLGMWLFRFWTN